MLFFIPHNLDELVRIWCHYLDVRRTVGGQVHVEAVAVRVGAKLLVDQNHTVVLYSPARLNDGAHRRQGRHIPLNVAARVVRCRLNEWTVILNVQDTESHLIFWIFVKTEGTRFHILH